MISATRWRWRVRRARAAAFEQLESLLRLLPSARNDHERTRIVDEARDVLNALERASAVTAEEWRALGRGWLGPASLPECRHNFRERDAKAIDHCVLFCAMAGLSPVL